MMKSERKLNIDRYTNNIYNCIFILHHVNNHFLMRTLPRVKEFFNDLIISP